MKQQCSRCRAWRHSEEFGAFKTCNKCREAVRLYIKNNRERYNGHDRKYRAADGGRHIAEVALWKSKNQERVREINRESNRRRRMDNPEHARALGREAANRRRARLVGATVEFFTPDELRQYWIDHDVNPDACVYCGGPHEHDDHVIPLSRGGTHERANLAPACERCNCSKHNKLLSEWRPEWLAA